ncbi:hypothetical protein [Nonlabens sp. Asnod3-A02]|uniref:hypothetical protein n=1 Tax=Nonlabens sp. Asnod3-A02 TaxID=3160579 RepID=UPI0038633502
MQRIYFILFLFLSYASISTLHAQVGINTNTPDESSILDITSLNKGVLIPRISLTGPQDLTTITLKVGETKPATGLLIYNTATTGASLGRVSPGFYYYEGTKWARLHDEGYRLEFKQTAEVLTENNPNTFIALPGLDTGTITFPYAGIYKISGNGYYSAGPQTGNGDGVSIGSLALEMEVNGTPTIVKERFVSAVSLDLGNNTRFDTLGQQVSYTFNFEANTSDSYRFTAKGREWNAHNTSTTGYFGRDSDGFTRSNQQNDAFRGSLIITLIEQF